MRRLVGKGRKAPLVVAGLIAAPLYFLSLMAASLALEKPNVEAQWRAGTTGELVTVYDFLDPTTTSAEVRIWLWALVPPAIVLAIGLAATRLRLGVAAAALAGIGVILALGSQVPRWEEHHTDRYPFGVDLIPDSNPSTTLLQGEWEATARGSIENMSWYLVGMAIAALLVLVLVEVRNRSKHPPPDRTIADVMGGTPEPSPIPRR